MSDTASSALRIAGALDRVTARFGQACAWLTVFLVLGTALVVVLRYGFGIGAIALQEAVLYSHALVFMGAAGWVLQRMPMSASISSITTSAADGRRWLICSVPCCSCFHLDRKSTRLNSSH